MSYIGLPQVRGIDFDTFTQVEGRSRSILDLQIGDMCNLGCIFCFTRAGEEVRGLAKQYNRRTGRIANLLTADEHESIINVAGRSGIRNLIISSEGENTLYEAQLLDTIEHARGAGFSVAMFTNGTRVDDRLARRLMDHQVSVIAKLNSLDPNKNSKISGCNGNGYTYGGLNGELVPDYILRLRAAGFSSENFALNFVVNSENQDELVAFWGWARDPATGIMPFGEFLELAGFARERRELEISPERKQALKKEVRRLDASLGHYYDELPREARLLDMRYLVNPHIIVVDSRGFVKDLAADFDLDSTFGNVRDISLEEVIKI